MSGLLAKVRRWFCSHEVFIEDIRRHEHETNGFRLVEAPCCRCGKVLTAIYGLALPAKLRQRATPTPPAA